MATVTQKELKLTRPIKPTLKEYKLRLFLFGVMCINMGTSNMLKLKTKSTTINDDRVSKTSELESCTS